MPATYRKQIERLFERSAFYREKLRAAGFDSPGAVGGLENIAALPFTEKDELRKSQAEHPPLGSHAAIDISLAAFEAIGCAHIPVGVGNTEKLLAALKQLSPQALACTPSYAMYIAERLSGART